MRSCVAVLVAVAHIPRGSFAGPFSSADDDGGGSNGAPTKATKAAKAGAPDAPDLPPALRAAAGDATRGARFMDDVMRDFEARRVVDCEVTNWGAYSPCRRDCDGGR